MTIDERLERHEALTQTVDLLHHQFREFVQKHATFESCKVQYSADVKDAIARLPNTAAAHNDKLDDHHKRIEKLES